MYSKVYIAFGLWLHLEVRAHSGFDDQNQKQFLSDSEHLMCDTMLVRLPVLMLPSTTEQRCDLKSKYPDWDLNEIMAT